MTFEDELEALLGKRVVVESKFAYIIGKLRRIGKDDYEVRPNDFSYIAFHATNVRAINVDFIYIE